jgi:two-component system copper resistance phosphate regulon response regulator CusR
VKILVVEDEAPTATALKRGLTEEGFAVDVASNATAAREAVAVYDYDTIILDVRLPGGDGFSLCRRWRESGLTTPILFLTACDDVSDRVRGLDLGADDYLVKPFAFEELLARVRALVRRGPAGQSLPELRIADLVIDTARRRVTRAGRIVPLTAREYQILEFLARNAGRVVTRTVLWEHVWESDVVPDSNVVEVYVRYLRNKLGREPDLIRTVRGGGYVLEAPAPEVCEPPDGEA